MSENGDKKQANWDNTVRALNFAKSVGAFEESGTNSFEGRYLGRPIIARDTPINGGIYVGSGDREAIVVDDTRKNSLLPKIYSDFIKDREEKLKKGKVGDVKEGLLDDVFALSLSKLPYSEEGVNDYNKRYGIRAGEKVPLDMYILEGVGICRHQALLVGYLLEKLKKDGYLKGSVSIDRNSIPDLGGHAWVRYTNSEGDVIIIDPAMNYVGYLKYAERATGWSYGRPK